MSNAKDSTAIIYPMENSPAEVVIVSHPSWDRVIRVAEQIRLMGVGRTQFYELARAPSFPKEIALGKRARGRWLSEMIDYIDSRKHSIASVNNESSAND